MVNYNKEITPATLDATFGALSDPIRRAMLERLSIGEVPVSILAQPFGVSLPAISKHLRVLEKAGLVTQEKDGRVRRCRFRAEPMQGVSDWIGQYQRFWEAQLDSLADYLDEIQQTEAVVETESREPENGNSRNPQQKNVEKES